MQAPNETLPPFLVFRRTGTEYEYNLSGRTKCYYTYEVDIWDTTYDKVNTTLTSVETALDGYHGSGVEMITLEDSYFQPEEIYFHATLNCRVIPTS